MVDVYTLLIWISVALCLLFAGMMSIFKRCVLFFYVVKQRHIHIRHTGLLCIIIPELMYSVSITICVSVIVYVRYIDGDLKTHEKLLFFLIYNLLTFGMIVNGCSVIVSRKRYLSNNTLRSDGDNNPQKQEKVVNSDNVKYKELRKVCMDEFRTSEEEEEEEEEVLFPDKIDVSLINNVL